jgi:hypothetical protein
MQALASAPNLLLHAAFRIASDISVRRLVRVVARLCRVWPGADPRRPSHGQGHHSAESREEGGCARLE